MRAPINGHCWRREADWAGGFWVRWRRGWGLDVRYRMRPDDYRAFSERMGLAPVAHIGPLTVTVLKPYGTGR